MKEKELTLAELQNLYEQEKERNAALEKTNASLAQENEHLENSLALAHDIEHQNPEELVSSFTGALFDAIFVEHSTLIGLRDSIRNAILTANYSVPMMNNTLTEAERRRMNSVGIRRLGFTQVVFDLSENENNQNFYPSHANVHVMRRVKEQLEALRSLNDNIAQLQRVVRDNFMVTGNAAYQIALAYYNNVRIAARSGVPGAQALFDKLRQFFRNFGVASGQGITEEEVLKDARGLLHGTKDGEIVIKNQHPHTTAGIHEVIDETHSAHSREGFKETIEGKESV